MASPVEQDSSPDGIKFVRPEDKVVSEVHPFLITSSGKSSKIKPLQKESNLIANIVFSIPKSVASMFRRKSDDHAPESNNVLVQDKDGDLVLPRVPPGKDDETKDFNIFIEYENATSLSLVGLQIWRGAFLLSDFVMNNHEKFANATVVELGAGTGLVGLTASLYAKNVVLTDLNEPSIIELLESNISHNKDLIQPDKISVMPLNFMDENWTPELQNALENANIILAADVIYHVDITAAFIRTLKKILLSSSRDKDVYIALEKRYIFTISDLDSVAPMHNHFLEELDSKLDICPGSMPRPLQGSNKVISMSLIQLRDLKQYFNYDKCKELILYHICCRKS